MRNEFLEDLLLPIRELFNDVKRKALMRLEYEGLIKSEAITVPGSRFYKDPEGFAMERYAYYLCFKCNKVYPILQFLVYFNNLDPFLNRHIMEEKLDARQRWKRKESHPSIPQS